MAKGDHKIGVGAGTEFVHNTDLFPSDEYLRTAPLLTPVLRHAELAQAFGAHERTAIAAQGRTRGLGLVSLALASVSLLGTALELLVRAWPAELRGGSVLELPHVVTVPIECCALLAIVLAGPWLSRARRRWLTARFMAEQIRLWHFQSLLDGGLVSTSVSAPVAFEKERALRFSRLMSQAPTAAGVMDTFVDSESPSMHFGVTPYTAAGLGEQVFGAFADLRLSKQLAYFKHKKEEFAVRDEWSEAVAKFALFAAVILVAGQLGLWLAHLDAVPAGRAVGACMLAGALALAVVSAVVRVYRSAMAVQVQREHYESKWVRLVALRAQFDGARSAAEKQAVMNEVEVLETEELRQFLRQMRRASFLL